jgi:hypothetical protein
MKVLKLSEVDTQLVLHHLLAYQLRVKQMVTEALEKATPLADELSTLFFAINHDEAEKFQLQMPIVYSSTNECIQLLVKSVKDASLKRPFAEDTKMAVAAIIAECFESSDYCDKAIVKPEEKRTVRLSIDDLRITLNYSSSGKEVSNGS